MGEIWYKNLYAVSLSFVKIGAEKALLYWRTVTESALVLDIFCPIWTIFYVEDVQENLVSCREFRENRSIESRTVDEFLSVISTFVVHSG
jgi:hypothetical protein